MYGNIICEYAKLSMVPVIRESFAPHTLPIIFIINIFIHIYTAKLRILTVTDAFQKEIHKYLSLRNLT